MSKLMHRASVLRLSLLGAALALTLLATIQPAFAACTPGAKRTIIVNIACCTSPGQPPKVTKQNQICNSSGAWVNNGSSYCASNPTCAI